MGGDLVIRKNDALYQNFFSICLHLASLKKCNELKLELVLMDIVKTAYENKDKNSCKKTQNTYQHIRNITCVTV